MSFLSRLFGRKGSQDPELDLDAELKRLEIQAQQAAPGYVGSAYNKAGDLAMKGGEEGRAMKYYGLAIDAFLEDMQREAARGVANKIIRVRPGAVRTLCTLTWLDLAAGHRGAALLHLRDYVEGAKGATGQGHAALTATQIYEMAKLSTDSEFIEAVGDALDSLDYSNRAEEVRGWVVDSADQARPGADEVASACMSAAVRSNVGGAALLDDEMPVPDADDSVTGGIDTAPAAGGPDAEDPVAEETDPDEPEAEAPAAAAPDAEYSTAAEPDAAEPDAAEPEVEPAAAQAASGSGKGGSKKKGRKKKKGGKKKKKG